MQLESDVVLNHMKTCFSGRMVYCSITQPLLDKYGTEMRDTDGLIDVIRSVKGVIIAAVISKNGTKYKVSLRSNSSDYAVNELAHKYNGGGHRLAAGMYVETDSLQEVEGILLKEVETLFDGNTL